MKEQAVHTLTQLPHNTDKRVKEVKVLMYHRLMDAAEARVNNHWTAVEQNSFREHLKVLEAFNYTAITFNDLKLHFQNEIELPKKPVIITFDDAYKDFYDIGYPLLKEFGMRAVIFALGDRSITENAWDDPSEIDRVPLMSDKELVQLHNEGFEIGAHSCTHPKLTEISLDEAEREIIESKESLERLLGSEINSFCYPFGLENKAIQQIVKDAGFSFGCTVYSGPTSFGESLFNIHRITIKNNMGALGFALRVLTPLDAVEVNGSKLKKRIFSVG